MNHDLLYPLLFAAAFVAGAINSVAGGGTLLTFPTLLAFLGASHSVAANATSTVALVPGSMSAFWGYRSEMLGEGKKDLLWLGVPSLIGGTAGAFLLLHTSDHVFAKLIPWLILGATSLFIMQEPLRRSLGRRQDIHHEPSGLHKLWPILLAQLGIALYGGFFGAGIGILMLAAFGVMGLTNIHRMNGLKNYAAICINIVASVTFIAGKRVDWPLALLMMGGAIIGGYGGAGVAQKLGQATVRRIVVFIGLAIGIGMLCHQLLSR